MTYEQMIEQCKASFNFSPNDRFDGVSHLLEIARRNLRQNDYYIGAARVAEILAIYVDQNERLNAKHFD